MAEYIRKRVLQQAKAGPGPRSLPLSTSRQSRSQYKSSPSDSHTTDEYAYVNVDYAYDRPNSSSSKKYDDDSNNNNQSGTNSQSRLRSSASARTATATAEDDFEYDFSHFSALASSSQRTVDDDDDDHTRRSSSDSTTSGRSSISEDDVLGRGAAALNATFAAVGASVVAAPLSTTTAMLPNNSTSITTPGSFLSSTKATTDAYLSTTRTTASLHNAITLEEQQEQELLQQSQSLIPSHSPLEISQKSPITSTIHSSGSSGGGGILPRKNILTRPVDFIFETWNTMSSWIGASPFRCWTILMIAILIEIYATALMKMAVDASSQDTFIGNGNTTGTTKAASSTVTVTPRNATRTAFLSIGYYVISLGMFGVCLQQIDVGIAYAIWSAIGTAAVAVAGMVWFGEPYTFGKVVSLSLILVGVVGLNFSEDH
jgi:multidrug transporter EmrE-like cation transporter